MSQKPKLEIASESEIPEDEIVTAPGPEGVPTKEELDKEEQEFRALRRDLPGVKGASSAGIVAISVGKTPTKNEFFRAHKDFRPIVPIVDLEVGMERHYFAVTTDMVANLGGIGITVTDHALYLTITSRDSYRARSAGQH